MLTAGLRGSILAYGDIVRFEAMPNRTRLRIAIVGAGVGGLTLALALRQRGIAFEIFEQAHELAEIGAAVALSANGTRELKRLGVLDSVVASSTEPTELIYRDGATGARIAAHPVRLGQAYRQRFGAPYCGLHRADLQRVLSAALGGEGLHLGRRLVELEDRGESGGAHLRERREGRGRHRRRGRRRPLDRPASCRRWRRSALFANHRVPGDRADVTIAAPPRRGGDPVLDGAARASSPLRHRPEWRPREFPRRRRRAGGVAASAKRGSSRRPPATRSPSSKAGIRPWSK